MATPIVIPRESQSMETGYITKWHAKIGDNVTFSQPLCEVESEKASFDIESPVNGTLLDIFYLAGETAPVLTAIAVVGNPGEDYLAMKPGAILNTSGTAVDLASKTTLESNSTPQIDIDKIQISPRARNLALKRNVPLHSIQGMPIKEIDIINYLKMNESATPAAINLVDKTGKQFPASGTGIGGRVRASDVVSNWTANSAVPVSGMRKTIAQKMMHSLQTTAQFTLNSHADATALLALRARFKSSNTGLNDISINDLILFAVARTLADFPEINSHFSDGAKTSINDINLGFAVSVSGGLLVPVIRQANLLNLKQLSESCRSLAQACREGNVQQQDLKGSTFTVSNLGAYGIESFTPILNSPEVGILGIGSIEPRLVRKNDSVEIINTVSLSLTVDHQVIDGAEGAKFLRQLSQNLQNLDILLAQ